MEGIATELGLGWQDAALGLIAGTCIYLAVVVITRIFGQRSLGSLSSFDFPVTVAVGAIVGRTALVHTSLAGGAIALLTIFSAQAVVGWLRNHSERMATLIDNPPLLLVEEGRILHGNLRRGHMTEEDLFDQLRISGIRSLDGVAAAVLERSGSVSVIRGDHVDPQILGNVEDEKGQLVGPKRRTASDH